MSGVVIVGAGLAGFQCCDSLRQSGYREPVTLIGDEPAAPYQRPPLSKDFLLGKLDEARLDYRPASYYSEHQIDLRLGLRVERIDREAKTVSLSNGERLSYGQLVLATGARVRRLPVAGGELEGVCYLRTLADVKRIRQRLERAKRLIVVGAGFIGLEFTAAARTLDKPVRVLEAADRVLARIMPPLISQYIERLHERHGAEIMCGEQLDAFIGEKAEVSGVRLKGGRVLPADLVVVGIGVLPNQELAAEAGVSCDNGIIVDENGRTSDPAIFAAGDCACYAHPHAGGERVILESVQNAGDQARSVAAAILGEPQPYEAAPWFWSDQYDAKLQIAGLSAGCDSHILRGDMESGKFSVFHYDGPRLRAVTAINMAADYMQGRKLLEHGRSPTPQQASDPAFPLKSLWKPAV